MLVLFGGENVTEQYVQSAGAKIWTVSQGSGMPVVLCTGGPGCSDYLEPVARWTTYIPRAWNIE